MSCDHIFACGTCNDRIARNDERHAEAIAAVRRRAEKAETEVARLRVIEAAARELECANDAALGAFRPRPDIAWRNLKVALRTTAAKPESENETPTRLSDRRSR